MKQDQNISTLYKQASQAYQAKNVAGALSYLQKILQSDSLHIPSLRLAGRICLKQKRYKEGNQCYRQILQLLPFDSDAWFKTGLCAVELNQEEEAIVAFRKVLQYHDPKDHKARNVVKIHLVKVYQQQAKLEEAKQVLQQILKKETQHVRALNLLGQIEQQMGNSENALKTFEKVNNLKPNHPAILLNLGIAYRNQKNFALANTYFNKVAKIKSDWDKLYREWSIVIYALGNAEEARKHLEHALTINPQSAENLRALQHWYITQANFKKSIAFGKKLIQLEPEDATAIYNIALAMSSLGVSDQQLHYFKKAYSLKPSAASAYGVGTYYQFRKEYALALEWFNKALAEDAEYYSAYYQIVAIQMSLADWSTIASEKRTLFETIEKHISSENGHLAIPYLTFNALKIDMDFNLRINQFQALNIERKIEPLRQHMPQVKEIRHKTKVRIAYISPDFRAHPMGRLMRDHFHQHDRTRFEVYAYNLTTANQDDLYHNRIRSGFDHFRNIYFDSTLEAASRIVDDAIDILIDLAGYTHHARTEIVALQPARIQINYLGYPNTSGAPFMDYILADDWLIPKTLESAYSEEVLRIPNAIVGSWHDPPVITDKKQALDIPDNAFVYASFNRIEKITPSLFDVWMEILQAVHHSVLWINGHATALQNLRNKAVARGIDPKRIVHSESVGYDQFLGRLQMADLFLDAHFYSAGATAVAAINMNLPLLTCTDQSYTSRMAASILHAAKLQQLICHDLDAYRTLAIQIGNNSKLYKTFKSSEALRKSFPLFNAREFINGLESVLLNLV